jgi:hypothetical protein
VSVYGFRIVRPDIEPQEGDTQVAFAFADYPLVEGAEGSVLVTRNGLIIDADALAITGTSVVVTLTADTACIPAEVWRCRYPVSELAALGSDLTAQDVIDWLQMPMVTPTEAQANRALYTAIAWANGKVQGAGLVTYAKAQWETAVLMMAWAFLSRGLQPTLSVSAHGVETSWGAVGGLNPSEELYQSATELLNRIGGVVTFSHPPATERLTDAMAAAADDVPISLRNW